MAFQPTLPARGATRTGISPHCINSISTHAPRTGSDFTSAKPLLKRWKFQPTLPARGATSLPLLASQPLRISTHAPRTGSDPTCATERWSGQKISTHAPRTGSDPIAILFSGGTGGFQPTLPARGATSTVLFCRCYKSISTHAPRTGSDSTSEINNAGSIDFNPRSPHGERRSFADHKS